MKNQFAVLHGGFFRRVMFEAEDSGDVYAWLKKNSELDTPGYTVHDRLSSVEWEEGTFIREFEKQMAKALDADREEKREAVLDIIRDINRTDRVGATNFDGEFMDSEEITDKILSIFEGKG